MGREIGPASEFYRLRLSRVDEGGEVEFEWRDDVTWRSVSTGPAEEADVWVVQAVTLDETETVVHVAAFASSEDAREALDDATADLQSMTRAEFEAEYLYELDDESDDASDA